MWNFLAALGLGNIVKHAVSDAMEKPYEVGSIDNSRLFNEDMNKVRFGEMTQQQLDRNIRAGKYRDNSPLDDYDLWIRRIEKYIEKFPRMNHDMHRIDLDYVKQCKAYGRKIDTTILWKYKGMDEYLK